MVAARTLSKATRALTPFRVDPASISPLAMPVRTDCATGFRGVYPHKGGYRGVVKFGGHLVRVCPTLDLPSQAASAVAEWFADRLGLFWADLVKRHRRHIWRYAPWRASFDAAVGGWVLTVWEWGMPVEVTYLGRGGKRLKSRPRAFASWREAADHVPAWMRARWGLLARVALFREGRDAGSPHPANNAPTTSR